MAIICPTITATKKADYDAQLNKVKRIAKRIHLDVSDGTLAPRELLPLGRMRWPKGLDADLHLMVMRLEVDIAIALELRPHLVIMHAEATSELGPLIKKLKQAGIKAGIALLQPSPPELLSDFISDLDHVLVFSGNLGYQGGSMAELKLLSKVKQIKRMNPKLEIGWDGGVNSYNIRHLVDGGVDVVNVGGYIQHAKSASAAYAKLETALRK